MISFLYRPALKRSVACERLVKGASWWRTFRTPLTAVLFLFPLAGCATNTPMGMWQTLSVLEDALSAPFDDLEDRARNGDAPAQYSLGIIYQYGLRGKTKAPEQGRRLKQSAVTPQQSYAVRNEFSWIQGQMNDSCAEALASGREDSWAERKCQGAVTFRHLKRLWDEAS